MRAASKTLIDPSTLTRTTVVADGCSSRGDATITAAWMMRSTLCVRNGDRRAWRHRGATSCSAAGSLRAHGAGTRHDRHRDDQRAADNGPWGGKDKLVGIIHSPWPFLRVTSADRCTTSRRCDQHHVNSRRPARKVALPEGWRNSTRTAFRATDTAEGARGRRPADRRFQGGGTRDVHRIHDDLCPRRSRPRNAQSCVDDARRVPMASSFSRSTLLRLRMSRGSRRASTR